jgi:hypothetical protein
VVILKNLSNSVYKECSITYNRSFYEVKQIRRIAYCAASLNNRGSEVGGIGVELKNYKTVLP